MKGTLSIPERIGAENVALQRRIDAATSDIRVASPGIIVSYDAEKQTATVNIAIKEHVSLNGSPWEDMQIPPLSDVPVVFMSGGGYTLTFPVKAGDECLLVFSDCCIDGWWQLGGIQNQIDRRRHDLSDAFAIMGPRSQKLKQLPGVSVDSVQLRNDLGDVFVEIKDKEINVVAQTVNVSGETVNVEATKELNITTDAATEDVTNDWNISAASATVTSEQVALSGDWAGLRALIDERFVALYNAHTHNPLAPYTPVVPLVTGDCNTEKVKAL